MEGELHRRKNIQAGKARIVGSEAAKGEKKKKQREGIASRRKEARSCKGNRGKKGKTWEINGKYGRQRKKEEEGNRNPACDGMGGSSIGCNVCRRTC